jgi:hypothetical protein
MGVVDAGIDSAQAGVGTTPAETDVPSPIFSKWRLPAELEAAQAHVAELRCAIEALVREVRRLESDRGQLEIERNNLGSELAVAKSSYEAIVNSTTWRLTGGLRAMVDRLPPGARRIAFRSGRLLYRLLALVLKGSGEQTWAQRFRRVWGRADGRC